MGMGGTIGIAGNQNPNLGINQAFGVGAQPDVRPGEVGGHVFAPGGAPANSVQNGVRALQQPAANAVQNQPQGGVKTLTDRKIDAVKVPEQKPEQPPVENAPKNNAVVPPERPKTKNPLAKMGGAFAPFVNDFIGVFNQVVNFRGVMLGVGAAAKPNENTEAELQLVDTIIDGIQSDSDDFKKKLASARKEVSDLKSTLEIDSCPEVQKIKTEIANNREKYESLFFWNFGDKKKLDLERADLEKKLQAIEFDKVAAKTGETESLKLVKMCPSNMSSAEILKAAKKMRAKILEQYPTMKARYVAFGQSKYPFSSFPPSAEQNKQIREDLAARLSEKIVARSDLPDAKNRLLQRVVEILLAKDHLTEPLRTDDPQLVQLMYDLDSRPQTAGKTSANIGTMTVKFGKAMDALAEELVKTVLNQKNFGSIAPTNIQMGATEDGTLELSFDLNIPMNNIKGVKLRILPEFERQTGRLNLILRDQQNLDLFKVVDSLPSLIANLIGPKVSQFADFLAPGAMFSVKLSDLKIPGIQGLGIGETVADNISDIKFSKQGLQLRFGGEGEGSTIGGEPINEDKLLDIKLQPSNILTTATKILKEKDLATFGKAEIKTRGADQSVTLKLSDVAIGETAKKKMGVFGKVLNFFHLTSFKNIEVSAQPKVNTHNGFVELGQLKVKSSLIWPLSSLANWAVEKFVRPKLTEKTNEISNRLHQIMRNDLATVVDRRTEMHFEVTDSGIGLTCVDRAEEREERDNFRECAENFKIKIPSTEEVEAFRTAKALAQKFSPLFAKYAAFTGDELTPNKVDEFFKDIGVARFTYGKTSGKEFKPEIVDLAIAFVMRSNPSIKSWVERNRDALNEFSVRHGGEAIDADDVVVNRYLNDGETGKKIEQAALNEMVKMLGCEICGIVTGLLEREAEHNFEKNLVVKIQEADDPRKLALNLSEKERAIVKDSMDPKIVAFYEENLLFFDELAGEQMPMVDENKFKQIQELVPGLISHMKTVRQDIRAKVAAEGNNKEKASINDIPDPPNFTKKDIYTFLAHLVYRNSDTNVETLDKAAKDVLGMFSEIRMREKFKGFNDKKLSPVSKLLGTYIGAETHPQGLKLGDGGHVTFKKTLPDNLKFSFDKNS